MLSVSVVVPSHNQPSTLLSTLECLHRQTHPPDEVIVVDDVSDPPLAELPGRPCVIARSGSRNLPAARNLGILAAKSVLVLFLDDDCLVPNDFVETHVRRHVSHPGHVVMGPARRIRYRGEPEFWRLPAVDGPAQRTFEQLVSALPRSETPWNLAPCGSNFSCARNALLSVGGYHQAYTGGRVESVDLTYRLLSRGVPLLVDSVPEVYHQEPQERQQRPDGSAEPGEVELHDLRIFAQRNGFWACGRPPADYEGPWQYPEEGFWCHARSVGRRDLPPAITVRRTPARGESDPCYTLPLNCIIGGIGYPYADLLSESGSGRLAATDRSR